MSRLTVLKDQGVNTKSDKLCDKNRNYHKTEKMSLYHSNRILQVDN